jgi:hypothetical protein
MSLGATGSPRPFHRDTCGRCGVKPFNELTAKEQKARRRGIESLFTTRKLTPEEKMRAEEKKKRDEPSIGKQLLYIMKSEAQKAVATSPEFQAGRKATKDKQTAGRAHGPA